MPPHTVSVTVAIDSPAACLASGPRAARWATALLALALASCGGGGNSSGSAFSLLPVQAPTAPATTTASSTPSESSTPSTPEPREAISIGGTVGGLKGSGLVLVNNGGDALAVSADGAFTFDTALARGAAYAVSVRSQPGGPSQVCTVNAGSGTVADAAVTGVKVLCATQAYAVGGTVGGLTGSGLVLQNNAADDLPVGADGAFVFPAAVASGAAYAVTVKTQPGAPVQLCAVAQGGGTIDAAAVVSVQVTCATQTRTVAVQVSGLDGQGLVLQNNAGDDLPVNASGTLQFSARVPQGAAYAVTVKTQPRMYSQTCTVSQGSGTAGAADISDVTVACVTPATRSIYVSSLLIPGLTALQRYSGAGLNIESATLSVADDLVSIVADPKGRVVFAGGADGRAYVIANSGGGDSLNMFLLTGTGQVMLGVHPNGQHLYATTSGNGSVFVYDVDSAAPEATPSHRQTRPIGFGSVDASPLAVDPLGRFVLVGVANLGFAKMPIQVDGSLGAPVSYVSSTLVSIAVHPSGAYLYTLSTNNYLRTYSINASTGALALTDQQLASFDGGPPASLGIDGRGRILTLVDPTNSHQYVRAITDTATGLLGPAYVQPASGVVANVFDPSREGVNYLLRAGNLERNTFNTTSNTFSGMGQTGLILQARAIGLLVR